MTRPRDLRPKRPAPTGVVPRAARLALLTAGAAWLAGCGAPRAPASLDAASTSDTLHVTVAGRGLVIPAPQGMVDIMSTAHVGPQYLPRGDLVTGIFVPRDRLQDVLAGPDRSIPHVVASIARENVARDGANLAEFERLRTSWVQKVRTSRRPIEVAVQEALARWRRGDHAAVASPFRESDGDTVVAFAADRGRRAVQLLVIGWDPVRRTHDLWGQEAVLVDGRIIGLLWLERGAFSMRALDEISIQLDLWADAILAVNARSPVSEG